MNSFLIPALYWVPRSIGMGLAFDLANADREVKATNALIHLVAGVAISALALLFGSHVACGAFVSHALLSAAHFLSIYKKEIGAPIRAATLVFGAVMGSLIL